MNLRTLFAGFDVEVPSCDVSDIAADSREVVRDGLFLACEGQSRHGLEFVGDALRAGAGAVAWEPAADARVDVLPPGLPAFAVPDLHRHLGELANRFFARPSERLAIAGITGTNGKTTTAWLVTQAMGVIGAAAGYVGTLGFGIGRDVRPDALTTPGCVTLHRRLHALESDGARFVNVEVSSHALDQHRVDGVRFSTVAFTNLTRDHLDYHGGLERYGAAKARLFELGAPNAVINLDDAFGRSLSARLPAGTRCLGISLHGEAGAALRADRVRHDASGISMAIGGDFGSGELQSPLWGEFNAQNLLLALGILVAEGFGFEAALRALAVCEAPPGRLQRIAGPVGTPDVIVDFAHTPDALAKALEALRPHCAGRLWCVFGCGGERDKGKRAPMGAAALNGADRVIVTDDNPRGENPQQIIVDILAGMSSLESVQVVPDRHGAIGLAIGSAGPGDVVLIAGKGHEDVQVVGTERRKFSDAAVARMALTRVGGGA